MIIILKSDFGKINIPWIDVIDAYKVLSSLMLQV